MARLKNFEGKPIHYVIQTLPKAQANIVGDDGYDGDARDDFSTSYGSRVVRSLTGGQLGDGNARVYCEFKALTGLEQVGLTYVRLIAVKVEDWFSCVLLPITQAAQ